MTGRAPEDSADRLTGQGGSHAHGVGADQVDLEKRDLVLGDRHVGKTPEARVDAVHGPAFLQQAVDHRTGRGDFLASLPRNPYGRVPPGDGQEVIQGQAVAIEDHGLFHVEVPFRFIFRLPSRDGPGCGGMSPPLSLIPDFKPSKSAEMP